MHTPPSLNNLARYHSSMPDSRCKQFATSITALPERTPSPFVEAEESNQELFEYKRVKKSERIVTATFAFALPNDDKEI
jgi:hypothetical protein